MSNSMSHLTQLHLYYLGWWSISVRYSLYFVVQILLPFMPF